MRNLIQEACQGPVREAVVAAGGERVAQLRGEDLRPVRLRDFQAASKVGACVTAHTRQLSASACVCLAWQV
jgi:hypothetical protein